MRLTIIPANSAGSSVRKTITLVRDEIKLEDQEAKARIVDLDGNSGHGPLRDYQTCLPSIPAQTTRNIPVIKAQAPINKLIEKLKQEYVQGIILDLRRNGGAVGGGDLTDRPVHQEGASGADQRC